MRYVLVPVPSEFVLDVMRWVLFRATEEDSEGSVRDAARLKNLFVDTDDLTRAVLTLVARRTLDDQPLTLTEAAEELEQEADSIRACLRRVNSMALGGGRELVAVATEPAVGPLGKRGKVAYLRMRPGHARAVRSLESSPDPQPA
jgi:hypothetical protein